MPLTCWAWFDHGDSGPAVVRRSCWRPAFCCCSIVWRARASSFPAAWWSPTTPITWHKGGSPLLWQHLFWFFGHPEVYIAILPGMGVASHMLSTFARKPVFGYRAMVVAICAIGFLGFCVWGHHMFISGMSPYSAFAFSLLTMTIGVPSAIKTFNWLGTLWGGKIQFTTAMLFALGFVSLFVTGGLSGLFLAQPSLDLYLHDTYFVVAHFHLIMGVAAIFGMFCGDLFLVSEDVRPDDERDASARFISGSRSSASTASSCRCTSWDWRAIRGATPIPAASISCSRCTRCTYFITIAAFITIARAASVPVQLLLEPEGREEGRRKSVERHDARMDDPFAAALR